MATSLSKIERINGNDNRFIGLLFEDGCDLFDWVMFALPFAVEREIIAAHLTFVFGRLPRALPNGLFYFGLGCATFHRLLHCVFGSRMRFIRDAIFE